MKKGQISIFIIIGILIIGVLGLVLYVATVIQTSQTEDVPLESAVESSAIERYITNCLQDATRRGIYAIALHGGYIAPAGARQWGEPGDGAPTKTHYIFEQQKLPTVFDGIAISMRSRQTIEQFLAQYIIVEFEKCADFSTFEEQGFQVQKPEIDWQAIGFDFTKAKVPYSSSIVNTIVQVFDESVAVTLVYPLIFTRDNEVSSYDKFSVQPQLRFGTLLRIAETLLNEIKTTQPYVITDNCRKYKTSDNLVNIYFTPNAYERFYALQIVDAQPTAQRSELPLKFQFAIKNVKVSGECVG